MLSVLVHGGAGKFFDGRTELKLPPIKAAMEDAWKELTAGKDAEYAVAAALRVMEGCEYFNAGYGGYPDEYGIVLLDVGLMRGDGMFASLMNARRMKYPSAVALKMMEERSFPISNVWTHELMTKLDAASDEEKAEAGWVSSHEELVAPFVKDFHNGAAAAEVVHEEEGTHGTVGCVVRDAKGHVAAGTSTGGVFGKRNGRIGDSPIIGAGVYADNEVGAISTTGTGEAIMGTVLTGYVLGEMRAALQEDIEAFKKDHEKLQEILDKEIKRVPEKYPNKTAGMIVMPPMGLPCYALEAEAITVASRSGTKTEIKEEFVHIQKRDGSKLEL